MSFFLYKPHVYGPEGVTTPDVIIDQLEVQHKSLRDMPFAPETISSEPVWHVREYVRLQPGFMYTAIGGGTLFSPILMSGNWRFFAPRCAWRLRHMKQEPVVVDFFEHTQEFAIDREELDDRGKAKIRVLDFNEQADAPIGASLTLRCGNDRLRASLGIEPLMKKTPGTKPRYSIGPTRKEVKHYNIAGRD